MAKRRGFGSISPQTGSKDKLKMDDLVDLYQLSSEAKNTWVNLRFLPTDMLPVKTHWIKILAGKEKKEVKIPKLCVSFDPDAEGTPKEGTHCPYCELTQGGEDSTCQTSVAYYANAIIRDIQEDEPRKKVKPTTKERKSGMIEKGSKAWTPVRVVRMPNGLAGKLDGLTERNIVKSKNKKINGKVFPIDHEKYGIDIAIKYDPKAAGAEKYQLDKGERSPLTEEEQEYLYWDLSDDLYEKLGLESTDEAKKEFKRLDFVGGEEIDDDEDEDDDDDDDIGFASKKKKGKKRRPVDDDDDDDEDDDDDDEDDDEPVRKKKKKPSKKPLKKKPSKKKKRPVDDDEDDDDEPVRKKKKKPLKKKKKSKF